MDEWLRMAMGYRWGEEEGLKGNRRKEERGKKKEVCEPQWILTWGVF